MQFIFQVTTEDDDKLSSSIMVFLLPFHLYFSLFLCFHLRRFFMFYVYPGVFIGLCLCYQFLSVSIFPSSPVFLSVSLHILSLSLLFFSHVSISPCFSHIRLYPLFSVSSPPSPFFTLSPFLSLVLFSPTLFLSTIHSFIFFPLMFLTFFTLH